MLPTLANALPAGSYYAYSYNVKVGDEPDFEPYLGGSLAEIGAFDEGCHDISDVGAMFTVATTSPSLAVGPNTFEGDNGGASPFYYNVNEIEIIGGTPPFNYQWDVSGYVRYSIIETEDAAYIYIIYADNAAWNVTVSDADDCEVDYVVLDNDPQVGETTPILDIFQYTITPNTGTANSPNGSIDISIEGGTPCPADTYTCEWYYQDGTYMGDAQDPTNLQTGWYTVYVTDCGIGEEQQATIGWYWVEPERRGRGKTGAAATLEAYPNPFEQTTTVSFSLTETSETNISLWSIDGKQVAEIYEGRVEAGEQYEVQVNAKDLPSGLYFVNLTTKTGESKRYKLILTK